MSNAQGARQPRGLVWRVSRRIFKTLWHALAVLGLGSLIYHYCLDVTRITSSSMSPTLIGEDWTHGDLLLTEKLSYRIRKPRRWEVITFIANDGVRIMKRVVGLPGETVEMTRDGVIVINGEKIKRPDKLSHLRYISYGNMSDNRSVACGEGYYVLGDDSKDSQDSRFEGPVPPDQLIGRAWYILAPSDRRGPVLR